MRPTLLALAVLVAACQPVADPGGADLPPIDPAGFRQVLAELDRPAVVNVWGSWCGPCRVEAPLLAEAYRMYGDRVEFIGLDVQDTQPRARAFIAEYGLEFTHYFDPARAVQGDLGGFGTPNTFFVAPGGEIIYIHRGVLDEQTLALRIDDLLAGD